MKTSNKLLLTIALITMGSIVLFDLALRAEYLKGEYKDPHYGLTSIPLKDFDAIEDYTSSETFLDVKQGKKIEVWLSKEAEKDLTFTVENRILKINFKVENNKESRSYNINVSCPVLKSLSTGKPAGHPKIVNNWGNVSITGFTQDTMQINVNGPGNVYAGVLFLKKMNATITQGSLGLGDGSKADTANFDIRDNCTLNNGGMQTGKVNYKVEGNATVTLSGSSVHQLSRL